MRFFKVNIPVKTYIRKYIEGQYPTPIQLKFGNTLGTLVYVCLEKQNSEWHKKKVNILQKRYELLTDFVTIHLPMNPDIMYRYGYDIPIAKAILINDFFEDKLVKDLHTRCEVYNKVGMSRNKAIDDFCEEYNIWVDEDIMYGTLKKAEYRYRVTRKKAKNKSMPQLSPTLFERNTQRQTV